jgi:hypothetical protein
VGPETGLDGVERGKYYPYRDSNSDPMAVQPVASRYPGSINLLLQFLLLVYDVTDDNQYGVAVDMNICTRSRHDGRARRPPIVTNAS